MTRRAGWGAAWAAWALVVGVGCAPSVDRGRRPDLEPTGTPTGGPDAGPGLDLALVSAKEPPPPVWGGTLAIADDGVERAVASDPDRDAVYVVPLAEETLRPITIALEHGARPWRIAIDGNQRAHVVLRGTGEVARIDTKSGLLLDRRAVCAAPRGIAYDGARDAIHVACATGELVTLGAAGGAVQRSVFVAPDLRDVVLAGGRLYVTRFRSAELLELDESGTLVTWGRPAGPPTAHVAWRAIALDDGRVAMSHQREADSVSLSAPSAYGADGSGCGSIVQSAITVFDGVAPTNWGASLPPLLVDVSRTGGVPLLAFVSASRGGALSAPPSDDGADGGCSPGLEQVVGDGAELVAVAYTRTLGLIAQSREPAALVRGIGSEHAVSVLVSLSSRSVADTGHRMFHMQTSAGLACASCHPEGHEDGMTWSFDTLGMRRTQDLAGGVLSTAPFHWNGAFNDLQSLLADVFVQRMGGAPPSAEHTSALGRFIDAIPVRERPAVRDPAAVDRGRALFASPELACTSCHAGAKLTNNLTVDVGTGGAFQVPSLRGLAARAPYLHNGCAQTLRDRFVTACGGGDRHGHTSHLSATQLDDLVLYLETL